MTDLRFLFSDNLFFIFSVIFILVVSFIVLKKSAIPLILKVIRMSAILLLAALILNPYVLKTKTVKKTPGLSVFVDARHSMRGPEKNGVPGSKFEAAKNWLDENMGEIKKKVNPSVYVFADADYDSAAGPDSSVFVNASSLSAAFEKVLINKPEMPDKILIFTDGNFQGEIDKSVFSAGAPKMDFVGMGDYPGERFASIKKADVPPFAFMHMPFKISFSAHAGGYKNKKLFLNLFNENGASVAGREIRPDAADFVFNSTFSVKPGGIGVKKYSLVLSSKKNGEKALDKKSVSLQIIREKTRIMYLCGKPSFEYARLRSYLKNKENVELVSFVILRDAQDIINVPEKELSLIPFPVNEIFMKDISLFDIFIVENFNFNRFAINSAYIKSFNNFVKRGGSLLFLGGDSAFSSAGYHKHPVLKDMLPVELSGKRDFTDKKIKVLGESHPMVKSLLAGENRRDFLKLAPELKGFNRFLKIKKGARSVFKYKADDGSKGILFAEKNHGKGRVAVFASPSSWRWKLAEGLSWKLEGFYDAFWNGVLNYLNGSVDMGKVKISVETEGVFKPLARLRVLDETYNRVAANESVDIRAFVEFAPPPLLSGRAKQIASAETPNYGKSVVEARPLHFKFKEPGIFEAVFKSVNYGRQKLNVSVKLDGKLLGSDEISFEFQDPKNKYAPANDKFLKELASASGGKYTSFSRLDDKFIKGGEYMPEVKVAGKYDVSNSMPLFILFCFLIFAEWTIRRFLGYF